MSIYDGLICWLRFTEGSGTTVYDRSDYKYTGTINGASWTDGRCGYALSCDGTNDYIQINSVNSMTIPNNFTICFWMKNLRDTGYTSYSHPLRNLDGGYGTNFWFNDASEIGILRYATHGTGTDSCSASYTLPAARRKEWNHIAGTFEKGVALRLYVNGVNVNSDTTGIPSYSYTGGTVGGNFRIGYTGWSGSDNYYCQGLFDDVMIFNRTLAAYEIYSLYRTVALDVESYREGNDHSVELVLNAVSSADKEALSSMLSNAGKFRTIVSPLYDVSHIDTTIDKSNTITFTISDSPTGLPSTVTLIVESYSVQIVSPTPMYKFTIKGFSE